MTEALNPVVSAELAKALSNLVDTHDVLPFMTTLHTAVEMMFRPLPDEMLALVVESEDYRPVIAGADPTWLAISGPEGHAEIIVYRALCDEQFYVVAPWLAES